MLLTMFKSHMKFYYSCLYWKPSPTMMETSLLTFENNLLIHLLFCSLVLGGFVVLYSFWLSNLVIYAINTTGTSSTASASVYVSSWATQTELSAIMYIDLKMMWLWVQFEYCGHLVVGTSMGEVCTSVLFIWVSIGNII